MKICVARNAEARSNAAIARVSKALYSQHDDLIVLSRNRYSDSKNEVTKEEYFINGNKIDNYEIKLKSLPGKGLSNIFQLVLFMAVTFIWFFKNKDKYDVIHAFDLDVGLPTFLIAKLLRKKYVYHIADFYADSRTNIPKKIVPLIKKMEFTIINNANTTIICTDARQQQIEGSNPNNLVVIHNTPMVSEGQLEKDKPVHNIPENPYEITLTYVGGLDKSRFIDSALSIVKDYPQIKLNIAGMGNLTDYVQKISLENYNIEFYGILDYHEALALYSKTDLIFALYDPSIANHKYSAPNKVYEAMLLGKPIIVARNSGIDKMVEQHEMGYVINYSNNSFRDTLDKIIKEKEVWKRYGSNAREAYHLYSWKKMERKIQRIYEEL